MSDDGGGSWTRYELHERSADAGEPWGVWSSTGRWWHDRASAEEACARVSEDYHSRWPDRACGLDCAVVEVVSRPVLVLAAPGRRGGTSGPASRGCRMPSPWRRDRAG